MEASKLKNFHSASFFNFAHLVRSCCWIRPSPHVSGYFWIRNFLFPDSKISPSKRGVFNRIRPSTRIRCYYSTNCNTIQIWSWCSRYLSSVGNRYPTIHVASCVGRKSEVKKCQQKDLKMLRAVLLSICWTIKQLSCSISRNIVWF